MAIAEEAKQTSDVEAQAKPSPEERRRNRTLRIELAELGYLEPVNGEAPYVRIRKTLPWGVMRETEVRMGPDGKIDRPVAYTDDMVRMLIVEWNVTPRSMYRTADELRALATDVDIEDDKILPLPAHKPSVLGVVEQDIIQAVVDRYNKAQPVPEGVKDFSKTS
jgi:hypothetical protein